MVKQSKDIPCSLYPGHCDRMHTPCFHGKVTQFFK